MLSRRGIITLTIVLTLLTMAAGVIFTTTYYKSYVWPYILIFLGFAFIRHLFFTIGIILDDRHRAALLKRYNDLDDYEYPSVSILVPCYNEEKVITQTLSHLVNLNYPNYEIIVIDDGSTDNTYAFALHSSYLYPHVPIKIVRKPNGGKASALNWGIFESANELIMGVDADGRLHPNALMNGAKHFMDQKVGSVAGFVEVEGQETLLEKFQQLEYMMSLNFLRKAYSVLGIVPVVPGPVGMFRREALMSVQGLTQDRHIFAEDAELSLRLIADGWKIRSEEGMVSYTEAPSDWPSFFRQRYRWNRGVFQALAANFNRMTFSRNPLSRFAAFHLYAEAWFLPLVNMLINFNVLIRLIFHNEAHFFTIWMGLGVFLDFWMLTLAHARSGRFLWAVAIFTLSKIFYENVLYFWRMYCLFDEWRAINMSWDKLDRKAVVKEAGHV